jgi:glyoxylase-like metal-dependent hydrolase (beta-lactamase superfamily II)
MNFAFRNCWLTVCALALAFAGLLPVSAQAQVRTGFPQERGLKTTDFPRVIKLAEGVYGYEDLRPPGFTTVSMFVVGTDGVLLVDGQWTAEQTQSLLDAIKRTTDKPLKWYVVGSEHADHTGGNSVLPKNIRYIVHPTSKRQLELDAQQAAAKPGSPPVVVPPVAMTSDRETVDVGGRKVDVLFLGRAHTGGDLMVHLPQDKILFMSEVYFNRVFPAMRSAYSAEWLGTIDKALKMDVKHFIPGHGFIEEPAISRVQLVEFRGALDYVQAEVQRLHKLGLSPEDAMKQAYWGPYGSWMLADSQREVAIRRLYREFAGEIK